MRLQMSSKDLVPSHNSHSRLFMSSSGRRNSLGARNILARRPSKRRNRFGCLMTMKRPVTPSNSGWGPVAPLRPHQTGRRTGYDSSSSSFIVNPQMSMPRVHPSKDSIQAIPVKAQRRIKSSRSVKFRRYHVATPRIEHADINNHHPSGIYLAEPSPSLGCRLKSRL